MAGKGKHGSAKLMPLVVSLESLELHFTADGASVNAFPSVKRGLFTGMRSGFSLLRFMETDFSTAPVPSFA